MESLITGGVSHGLRAEHPLIPGIPTGISLLERSGAALLPGVSSSLHPKNIARAVALLLLLPSGVSLHLSQTLVKTFGGHRLLDQHSHQGLSDLQKLQISSS